MNREEKKQKFIELAGLIKETGRIFGEMLFSSDANKAIDEILKLETKGDEIQDLLDRDFATQKNIPYLAIDRAKLLRRMDTTLDEFRLATLTYRIYSEFLPDDFGDRIVPLADNIREMSSKLAEAIETIYTSFKEVLVMVNSIENLRDKAQDLSYTLQADYFKSLNDTTDWKKYQAVKAILGVIIDSVAAIKGASEVLTLMAYKYD